MPKVCLTEAQRQEAAIQATYQKVADGLAAKMNREHLTQQQIGDRLGITRQAVSKLLNASGMRIDVRTMLKVLHLAGMEVKRRDP